MEYTCKQEKFCRTKRVPFLFCFKISLPQGKYSFRIKLKGGGWMILGHVFVKATLEGVNRQEEVDLLEQP
jgi:hypothetical protein